MSLLKPLLLILFFLPRFIYGQELLTNFEFLGFSDDLKYCAYEMYATGPVEGDPVFSIYYFIDVDKNDYATRPVTYKDTLELSVVRQKNRIKAEPLLKQFKISDKKLGTQVTFASEPAERGERFKDVQVFHANNKNYTLKLSTQGTGVTIDTGQEEQMVIVDLEVGNATYNLQPATKNPRSWGFVIGFQFLTAYRLENKLAVFVEYQGPGFEGSPDRQQMIVTGVLR